MPTGKSLYGLLTSVDKRKKYFKLYKVMTKSLSNRLNRVLATVLTIVALTVGQSNAWATDKTVTYTINYENSPNSNASVTFTPSGEGFGSLSQAKTTIYNYSTATSCAVQLNDGLELGISLSGGAAGFNSIDDCFSFNHVLGGTVTFMLRNQNYYIKHVKLVKADGTVLTGTSYIGTTPITNVSLDRDVDIDLNTPGIATSEYRASVTNGNPTFGQFTVTLSDTPREYSITYVDAVHGENGVTNPNPTSYNVSTPTFQITALKRPGYIANSMTYTDTQHANATTAALPITISRGEAATRKDITYNPIWTDVWGIAGGADGSAEHPYLITTTTGLELLGTLVNAGNNFSGTFFKLDADITYDGTENNHIAIGNSSCSFQGHFDGGGHTISGINININLESGNYQGLFGYIHTSGIVENVILANTTITANENVGGIVGINMGTVRNCRVESNVSIKSVADNGNNNVNNQGHYKGGIAGCNEGGTIVGCVSSASVSQNDNKYCEQFGGIVGRQTDYENGRTVRDCLYTGSTVTSHQYTGAIIGYKVSGTLTNNYYTAINLGGIGEQNTSSDQDGARRARTVTLDTNVTLGGTRTIYNVSGLTAYGNTALSYAGIIYSGEGQTLTLGYTDLGEGQHATFSYNDGSVHALADNQLTMPAGNVTVSFNGYATNTYYVSFNANGGSGTMSNQTFTYGVEQNLTANAFTRSGYAFTGWSTTKNGSVEYSNGQSVSNLTAEHLATVTLYAQWTPDFATHWHADDDHDGTTAERAYIITSTSGLDLLANLVNGGNKYSNTYFKLGANITYSTTSNWNDATSTENNYTAIGKSSYYFDGIFDGQGHTISGIRIYKGGDNNPDNFQGLFGYVGTHGTVKNLTISDARITGRNYVGGIAGHIEAGTSSNGTIENCHATATVCIHTVKNSSSYHGGIVGNNRGYTLGCTSSAMLTIKDGLTSGQNYGGIVGCNHKNIFNCLALGVVIPSVTNAGPIYGQHESGGRSLNFYHDCTIGGNTINTGSDNTYTIPGYTVTCSAGITAATGTTYKSYGYDGLTVYQYGEKYGITYNGTAYYASGATVTLNYTGGSETFTMPDCDVIPLLNGFDNSSVIAANTGSGKNVILSGRTLYKDGTWNTLCLPFNLTIAGSLFEGDNVDVRTLTSTSFDCSMGKLTMNFTPKSGVGAVTELVAGTPYIIMWSKSNDSAPALTSLVNPVFRGVTINETLHNVETTYADFCGTYDPIYYNTENRSVLFLSAGITLHHPDDIAPTTIGACRAYFELKNGLIAGERISPNTIRAFNLNFGDGETTDISTTKVQVDDPKGKVNLTNYTNEADAWYSIDGRKLSGKPTAKGVYINNGKKIVIK